MNKTIFLIPVVVLIFGTIGCASLKGPSRIPDDQTAAPWPYVKRALAHEDRGEHVEARRAYGLALTLQPDHPEALAGKRRVQEALNRRAKTLYREGLKFYRQGRYGQARHRFLKALRLRPDYPEVVHLLTTRKRIQTKRYIIHTLKTGESLSRLAERYYGDHWKFPIIAGFNNIPDATRVRAGQKIKIPEIKDVPFLIGNRTVQTADVEMAESEQWTWDAGALQRDALDRKAAHAEISGDRVVLLRDRAKEHLEQGTYKAATALLEEALRRRPGDPETLEGAYRAYFEWALALFEQEDYLGAKQRFERSLLYREDCGTCRAYIKKCEAAHKEHHYRKGIELFAQENLKEAIEAWRRVEDMDPDYKRIQYLIQKAEKISKKLDEVKKRKAAAPQKARP